MATVTLGMDLLASLDALIKILDREEAVRQQQVLELLVVRHIFRAVDDLPTMDFIADSFAKHVKQLVRQRNELFPMRSKSDG